MKAKATVRVDPQGRLMIPAHIRKELNLLPGDELGIDVDPFGTIHLESTKKSCFICGKSPEKGIIIQGKAICRECAFEIGMAVK